MSYRNPSAHRALFIALLLTVGSAWAAETAACAEPRPAARQPPGALTRLVTYGEPVEVEAAILRATTVVLNADERLLSITEPDAERWQVDWAQYGPDTAPVPVVSITPTDCGLTTNIAVLTTKRIYPILLRSPRCDRAANDYDPQVPFDALVRYRYPAEGLVRTVAAPAPPVPTAAVSMSAPLEELVENAGRFRWKAKRGYRGPMPVLVTEDGVKTFVSFRPDAFRGKDLPLLFLLRDDGERELVTYEVEGETFIIPRLFEKAILVQGAEKPKKQPHLVITRRGAER
jgi:type IV secretion system protein VirB9